jgi:hypothetical protein
MSGRTSGLDSRRNLRVLRSISWGIAIVAVSRNPVLANDRQLSDYPCGLNRSMQTVQFGTDKSARIVYPRISYIGIVGVLGICK